MLASEIRLEARQRLQGLWGKLVPIWLIYILITWGVEAYFGKEASFFAFVVTLVIGGPFLMGLTRIFLRLYNKESFEIGNLFDGFNEFTRSLTAYLLMTLYIFLWMLLLVIPGIVAALGYSMTFFIMAENPEMIASDAMRESKLMMFGHKWELFNLFLSFLGWIILSAMTLGIGFLWLESYVMTAMTIFYKNLKMQKETLPLSEGETIVSAGDGIN
jgi:uncharacterized membrane protein